MDKLVNNCKGVFLEYLSWMEAEKYLTAGLPVVFPLGAAAKEHGPHLPLNNDAIIADWLAHQICNQLEVVIAPLINASFYPAFVEYPGSISLREETARDFLIDSCKSLAAFGCTDFYILNTGVSTEAPLKAAQVELAKEKINLQFLSLKSALARIPAGVLVQEWGSHADEHETSLMLHIAPDVVDMSQARDDGRTGQGRLSRTEGSGTWSASGIFGQATLADAEKREDSCASSGR